MQPLAHFVGSTPGINLAFELQDLRLGHWKLNAWAPRYARAQLQEPDGHQDPQRSRAAPQRRYVRLSISPSPPSSVLGGLSERPHERPSDPLKVSDRRANIAAAPVRLLNSIQTQPVDAFRSSAEQLRLFG